VSQTDLNTQIRLFDSLPRPVQTAIVGYANAAQLSPSTVTECALRYFLELPLSPPPETEAADLFNESSFLNDLSHDFQVAIAHYATRYEMPAEFVVELAIAHFLDPDSVTFDDCQTAIQRDRVDWLINQQSASVSAA
jgi:hypothetical protein